MLTRLLGILLIIRALTPIILVLLIAGLALTVVRDVQASLEKPLSTISEEIETLETALADAQDDFLTFQRTVGKLIEDLQNFTIPNPLANLKTNITIPSITIPDLPPLPIPKVSVSWSNNISIRYPSGISFSFSSGLDVNWRTINIRYPTSISVTTEDFNLSIPDIPAFTVNIPGMGLLRDAVEGVIDKITGIFDVFDPAFQAIEELALSLKVLPDSIDAILTATRDGLDAVRQTVARWGTFIVVVTLIILILIVNYIFATMMVDLQRGWLMLRGRT